jgi:hypothetical protein
MALFQGQFGEHKIFDDTSVSITKHIQGTLSMGIPNIRSLCHKAIFMATNLDPKVEDLMVFCCFEYQHSLISNPFNPATIIAILTDSLT